MADILFLLWIIVVNAIGFNLMYKDKLNAAQGGRRVRESYFFIIAALMGAVSIYASMYALRHKLRKYYFKYGMTVLLIENIVLALAFVVTVTALR